MIEATAGTSFEASVAGYPPGLYGTLTFEVQDGQGNVVTAPRATGIVESPAASGVYFTTGLAPMPAGTFFVVWDPHTTGQVAVSEELVVTAWEGTALDLLRAMTDATTHPVLSDGQLTDLLSRQALPDTAGRPPADPGWTPTYAVEAAAAAGWMLKAARLTGNTDIADEAAQVKRSQAYDHAMAMVKLYRAEADRVKVQTTAPPVLARFTEQPYEPLPRESAHYDWTSP
jgi:hypothetical protein